MPESELFASLPNIHPAVVHFPLALLPAAVLFDVMLLMRPQAGWADRAAAWLYTLAALAAFAATRAGKAAAESLGALPPAVYDLLHEHERLAERCLWLLGALALLRLFAAWRDRWTGVVPRGLLRVLVLLGGLAGIAFLFAVADLGGRMVYQHGVAVAAPPPSGAPS
jgi:uncharacterized membrane protein